MRDEIAHHEVPLLGPDDPPVFEIIEGTGQVLLICDHGGRAVPRKLRSMGLDERHFDRHIAWDIGAEALTRELAGRLGWMAVIARYSRLVIDPNRELGDASSIPEKSDGTLIPANKDLSPGDRRARETAIFRPYHMAVHRAIETHLERGIVPAILSVHTFTPSLDGEDRPWQVSVLWIDDWRLPKRLLAALRDEKDLTVGDNQPYSARQGYGYTMQRHADAHGFANATFELRQDEIDTPEGFAAWGDRLARIFRDVFAGGDLNSIFERDQN